MAMCGLPRQSAAKPGAWRPGHQGERELDSSAASARWTRAVAAFRRAEARLAAFRREATLLPPAARAFPASETLDARFDDLECARLAALSRLLRAPAPDLAAFSLKLDLAIADQAWELTDSEPCLAALKADARRLASLEAGTGTGQFS